MDTFLDIIGAGALVLLAVIGLAAGLIAGFVTGRNKLAYAIGGVLGAMALPFVLAALGVTFVVGAGLLVVAIIGIVGAVILLALVRGLFGRGSDDDRR